MEQTQFSHMPAEEAGTGSPYIEIYGACEHNLKNLSLRIPREKLTVITGISGSGKSSLAFDTLYASAAVHGKFLRLRPVFHG